LHLLAAPIEATRVRGQVDGARRRDHRQQHHGQHLLSRALLDDGARTIAFHLGALDTTIDLDCWLEPAVLAAAVRRANDIVWEGRPVSVRTVSREEATRAGCAVPEEAGERVRLVEAEGFDLQPCSGTHPARTSEVGVILVTGLERYKGGGRVRFVCGDRALTAFQTRQSVLGGLSAQLSAPLLELSQAVERTQQELEATRRRAQQLLERAVEGDARRLLAEAQGTPAFVVQVLEGASLPELRSLAQRITALAPAVALLGTRGDSAQVVFARSPGLGVDIGALLKDALAALGGRGGGRGDLVQGGGPELARLDEALAAAEAAARQALAKA
jgi:alanyl-tRNA synthetase